MGFDPDLFRFLFLFPEHLESGRWSTAPSGVEVSRLDSSISMLSRFDGSILVFEESGVSVSTVEGFDGLKFDSSVSTVEGFDGLEFDSSISMLKGFDGPESNSSIPILERFDGLEFDSSISMLIGFDGPESKSSIPILEGFDGLEFDSSIPILEGFDGVEFDSSISLLEGFDGPEFDSSKSMLEGFESCSCPKDAEMSLSSLGSSIISTVSAETNQTRVVKTSFKIICVSRQCSEYQTLSNIWGFAQMTELKSNTE